MAKKKKKSAQARPAPELPIEESMAELEQIVQSLESGDEPLEVSLQKFERGMQLLRSCHRRLDAAAARIEILTGLDDDGEVTTAPFEGNATFDSSDDSMSDETTLF